MATTANRNLPRPSGSDLSKTGDNDIRALADALDNAVTLITGSTTSRPPTAPIGTAHLDPITGVLTLYVGSWIPISAEPPVGSMLDYAADGDPADTRWVVADGRTLSRTTYASLFAAIGTKYGAGNGSTTFAVPDTRGRTTVGPDTGVGTGAAGRLTVDNTAGASGGVASVTLTDAQIPTHGHSATAVAAGGHSHTGSTDGQGLHTHGVHNAGGHSHNYTHTSFTAVWSTDVFAGSQWGAWYALQNPAHQTQSVTGVGDHSHALTSEGYHAHNVSTNTVANHTHTINVGTSGLGQSHTNMSPYLVAPKIIRVK